MKNKPVKKYAERMPGKVRSILVTTRMNKDEYEQFKRRHGIKDGDNMSNIVKMLCLSGSLK